MPEPAANGRTPAGAEHNRIQSAVRRSSQTASQGGLLAFTSQLSRKLSWSIATSWEATTGHKLPRGAMNDLVEAYTVLIATELAHTYPLHITTDLPPPESASSADEA